jgi:hypothetical protein
VPVSPFHDVTCLLLLYAAAEEFALHMIIDNAKDGWLSGEEAQEDSLEGLPYSTMDEAFDMVSDVAFQDHDVMMLFDMPQVWQATDTRVVKQGGSL